MSFSLDLNAWANKAKDAADKKVRGACFELTRRVIQKTPVSDTKGGRLRANWQASINSPAVGEVLSKDPTGQNALMSADSAIKNATGNVFWLTNNLPYAAVVEFGLYKGSGPKTINGFSTQAPTGTARVSVEEVLRIIQK